MENCENNFLRSMIYHFIFSSAFSHKCTSFRDTIYLLVDFNLVNVANRLWTGNSNWNIYINNNFFLWNGFFLIIVHSVINSSTKAWCSRLCPRLAMRCPGFYYQGWLSHSENHLIILGHSVLLKPRKVVLDYINILRVFICFCTNSGLLYHT